MFLTLFKCYYRDRTPSATVSDKICNSHVLQSVGLGEVGYSLISHELYCITDQILLSIVSCVPTSTRALSLKVTVGQLYWTMSMKMIRHTTLFNPTRYSSEGCVDVPTTVDKHYTIEREGQCSR